jgi:predicted permease
MGIWQRLKSWFPWNQRRQREADLERELRNHLELEAEERREAGLSSEEAAYAARRALGNTSLIREDVRTAWGFQWLDTLLQDLRYGLRQLRRNPGFTAVAVLTLALGIGANAAIFQLIDAVRLRTVPAKDPHTLAIVHLETNHWRSGNFNGPYAEFTYPLWEQVRKRQQAFSSIATWAAQDLNLAQGGEVNFAHGLWVSGEFFTVVGVQPFLGRLISASDDQPGGGGVDLSYGFWQKHYGGDASVIGKTLTLDSHTFPILGVTPPGFYGVAVGQRFDVAIPVCAEPVIWREYSRITSAGARRDWWLNILGRLKPGWTFKRATAQLSAITSAALNETIPPQYDSDSVKHYLAYKFEALPGANGFSNLRKSAGDPLWLLLGLSGLVLLIACANLANLMLARASSREREIAVRLALGAGRRRVIRQLLSESILLAAAGAACGGVLAAGLSRALIAFIATPNNPIFLNMPTDWRVVGFIAGLAVLTTILFGLLPAWRAGSASPGSALKAAGRGVSTGRERFRLQRILVASQVALSLVLLAGALLFSHSLANLMTRNPGFQQNGVLVANIEFTRLKLPDARRNPFVSDLLDRVRAVPGVASAAASDRSPVNGNESNRDILDKHGAMSDGWSYLDNISPGYFRTMERAILAGRDFNEGDSATSPKVAIVNQAFVKKFLGGAKNAVGMRFRVRASRGEPEPYYTVIGVVDNSVYDDMHAPLMPVMYFPRTQVEKPYPVVTLLIRSKIGAASLLNSVKSAIVGVNPEINIQFAVLRTQIHNSLVQDALIAALCGFFGALAVFLAVIGLYGVISYTIARRTNEIGIRMALGAQRSGIIRLILGEVSLLIGAGVFAGVGLTLAGGKAAGALLYGLKAHDPLTLVLAAIILAAAGLLASYIPARRASKVDPMVALRYE